ncbi:hypothetical protein ACLOJK_035591 [Asimina triloba]
MAKQGNSHPPISSQALDPVGRKCSEVGLSRRSRSRSRSRSREPTFCTPLSVSCSRKTLASRPSQGFSTDFDGELEIHVQRILTLRSKLPTADGFGIDTSARTHVHQNRLLPAASSSSSRFQSFPNLLLLLSLRKNSRRPPNSRAKESNSGSQMHPSHQMAQPQKPISLLEFLGEEIIRIVTPVSACMMLVVLLVTALKTSSSSSPSSLTTIATIAYDENSSGSGWSKFLGAVLNSLAFIAIITVVTFLLVLLFYFRCIRFLKFHMAFSAFVVLGMLGGEVSLLFIQDFRFPVDCVTFFIVLFNFTVAGVMSVFTSKAPIVVNQGYLVVIGMLVAYWFTLLPEWTTWVLLVAMALYDLAAVLLPGGPLRLLVELAISRDEEIPALVYEARPVTNPGLEQDLVPGNERRLWRGSMDSGPNLGDPASNSTPDVTLGSLLSSGNQSQDETALVVAEEGRVLSEPAAELTAPLLDQRLERLDVQRQGRELGESRQVELEGIGLGSSGAIKLGLGDFIFYSVLVGRAAMYDFMTVYACYLAIIAGLGITLMLLAFYRKALPALPVSIALGVLFYFLTRIFLEMFIVQTSINLLMF